jgi:hypothetical protein
MVMVVLMIVMMMIFRNFCVVDVLVGYDVGFRNFDGHCRFAGTFKIMDTFHLDLTGFVSRVQRWVGNYLSCVFSTCSSRYFMSTGFYKDVKVYSSVFTCRWW